MNEIMEQIESLEAEIKRIEEKFPTDSARILIRDINEKINKLAEDVCPF